MRPLLGLEAFHLFPDNFQADWKLLSPEQASQDFPAVRWRFRQKSNDAFHLRKEIVVIFQLGLSFVQ